MDATLSWKHHVDHMSQKISRALYAIKQVKHFLPTASLKTLYYATVPNLSYSILVWGNAPKSTLKRVAVLQKRAKCINHKLPNSFEQVFHHNYEIHENRETRQSALLHVDCCLMTTSSTFSSIWNK